jgi:4-amino-4-deoxy-L-arabinose transferase-like glycosyltransferase
MSSNRFWTRGVFLQYGGLAGIVVLAFSLRLWNIGFGLPYIYHPDEPRCIDSAQFLFKTGNLNPRALPNTSSTSCVYVLNAAAYVPYYLAGKMLGVFHHRKDVPALEMLVMGTGRTSMPSTVLLGRTLTVLFGVGNVVLVFLIGRVLLGSPGAGLLAALMLAVSPTNVTHSRYITPDTFLVFFVLAAFWGAAHISRGGKLIHYALSGAAIGCAVSTKVNGVLVALPCLIAHFYNKGWRQGLRRPHLYVAIAAGAVGCLATTPFLLVNPGDVVRDILFEGRHYSSGHAGMEGDSFAWYVKYLWQVEGIAAVLMIAEVLRALYLRSKPTLFLAVYPVIWFLFIISFIVRNDRTLMPMTPFVFLLASSLLTAVGRWLGRSRWNSWAIPAMAICVSLVLARPLMRTVKDAKDAAALGVVDARETSRVWIEKNLPAKSRIAIESYSPFVDPTRFEIYAVGKIIDFPPETYMKDGFDYLVFSSRMYRRFLSDPKRYALEASRYDLFFKIFPLVKRFDDGGCEIRVCRVKREEGAGAAALE